MGDEPGDRPRVDPRRLLHPGHLVAAAGHRDAPIGRDLQPGERALDADRAGRQVDAPDIRGDTPGEWSHARPVPCPGEPETPDRIQEVLRRIGHRGGVRHGSARAAGAYPLAADTAMPLAGRLISAGF